MPTSAPSTTPTEEGIPTVEEVLERLQADLSPTAILLRGVRC